MTQQPEVLYLAILFAVLVLMRSSWPWTRTGGVILLTGALVAAWWWRTPLAEAAIDARRLPPTVLALLTAVVGWWSLFKEHGPPEDRAPATGRRQASRLRFAGVASGMLTIAALAVWLGAPSPALDGEASQPSWFFAGLLALAPITGTTFACFLVPLAAIVGLLMAPDLDAQDEHGGRRDELPYFLFAWLAVGVVPIVLAAWWPSFSLSSQTTLSTQTISPVPGLSQRFWLDWLGLQVPSLWLLRELPGFLLYGLIFALLPWKLPTWKASKGVFGRHLRRLGAKKYVLVMGLTGTLMLTPLKVALFVFAGVGPWIIVGGLSL